MSNLNDLINLAKADGGKFFVIDETGEPKLVIMPMEEYQKMLLGKLQKQVQDIEQINKLITKVQLEDSPNIINEPQVTNPDWTATERGSNQLVSKSPRVETKPLTTNRFVDLREEVIDLSFDFEGPKTGIEEI